jgi:glycosyltransferase involved in cell wall biosynthesis
MSILIFLHELDLSPAGGPLGVGYYIHQEVHKRNLSNQIVFLPGGGVTSAIKVFIKNIVSELPEPIKKHIRSIRRVINVRKLLLSSSPNTEFEKYDAVHFHSTLDLWLSRDALKNYKGVVILTSHSPVPLFEELEDCCTTAYERFWFKANKRRLVEIDRFAFSRSDYVIFPTEGAMDAYYSHWPEFKSVIKDKQVCFITTGISPRFAQLSRSQIIQKLGLATDDFLISYAGRHNYVKGYDLLKNLAKSLFEIDGKIKVIAAGTEQPLKRLDHPSWLEVGFTKDPYSYIAASDLLIVPNRETYFDLVILEGLSLGKIILASNVGGNKYFCDNDVPGVFLYGSLDEAKQIIKKLKEMPLSERAELGRKNFDFYNKHLTLTCFFDSYLSFLNKIGVMKN